MPKHDDYAWVPVLRALNPIHARLVAARLDDQGIPVTYRNDGGVYVTPVAFSLPADFIILVPDEYYDRALAILRDLDMIEDDDEDDEYDDDE